MKHIKVVGIFVIMLLVAGCMRWDYIDQEELAGTPDGLFIANEGNFQYGNATLSFYNPAANTVENEIFARANGFKLGDVAQSLVVRDDRCWVVVNNSHVVFAINADNFREVGRIENLPSPRYIHFVDDRKAYITQLWDNRIFIVDPRRFEVTDYITVPDMLMESGSTEQMVQIGDYVYCNCWSYQNRILKIDTSTDRIVASLNVGIQPQSIAADRNGRLWVVTDGGYDGSPYGFEAPKLVCIDAATMTIEREWTFDILQTPRDLHISADGATLYWINDDVWAMSVDALTLPATPLIPARGTIYYGFTVSPYDGDIYVADAIDYQQPGKVYRYNPQGRPVDEFSVGINPGAFAWR